MRATSFSVLPDAYSRRISTTSETVSLDVATSSPFLACIVNECFSPRESHSGCKRAQWSLPLRLLSGCRRSPWRSPRGILSGCVFEPCRSPVAIRPFRAASTILSFAVPTNKCSGLTHLGTSHRWHTKRPGGTGPLASCQAILWVEKFLRLALNCPYPDFRMHFVHIQHSDGPRLSTWLQNLATSFGASLTNGLGKVIGRSAYFIGLALNCVKAVSTLNTSRRLAFFSPPTINVN